MPRYDYPGIPEAGGEDWARFVILGTSVVWRLWPPEGERMWSVEVDGERYEDAPALWACFARQPMSFDLSWHAAGGASGSGFFAGSGCLQDIELRIRRLAEVAAALIERWNGSALRLISEGDGHAGAVSRLITDTIPGYLDRPVTELGVLCFDKLSNLATAMLASRLPIEGVDQLPVFPDYMLPRVLRHHGMLVYTPELAEAVDQRRLIAAGSHFEHAIRWGTVYAAEQLCLTLAEQGNPVTTPQLDYHLWSEAVLGPDAAKMGEHHRTVTEAY